MNAVLQGSVLSNLAEFRRVLSDYAHVAGMTPGEAVDKKGRQLTFELYRRFKAVGPGPGQIRREAEARKWRTKVRDSVLQFVFARSLGAAPRGFMTRGASGRRLTFQAKAVEREMRVRESGRYYTAAGWLQRGWRQTATIGAAGSREFRQVARRGKLIGRVRLDIGIGRGRAYLENTAPGVAEVEQKHKLLAPSIAAITADTRVYLDRKLTQDATRLLGRTERAFKR